MRFWLTVAIIVALLALSFRRGGQPEKLVALAFAISFTFVLCVREIVGRASFLAFDPISFMADFALQAVFVWIALRANRFWTICICSLQLIILATHIAKFAHIRGMAGVYWGMTTLPIYAQYLVLLFAIRAHANRVKRIGQYPDWT